MALGGTQDVFFPRSAASELPTIVRGDGIHLVDDQGRRLLDVASGPFLAILGQGNERVLQAMLEQGRQLTYTYSRTTRHAANARLTERLAALAGPGFERVHLTSGGSEAVEMALKFLRQHAVATGQPDRHRVISMLPGYHGATTQTLGLNGDLAAPALWGPLTVPSEKIPAPLTFRAASPEAAASASIAALEAAILRLGPDQVLAFVMEPIGGQASGVNVPHPSFARGVRRVCDDHGVRLVFDEIVTAFRTGRFLAAHHDPDARPDVVALAKGLGAGYAPLGAFLAPAALVDQVSRTTGFVVSHSYDANPMACAAGSAVLDEVVDRDLIANAARMGARLRAGLDEIAARCPLVGDVRGRGLLLAIELVADGALARFPADRDPGAVVRRHGRDHGLLLYSRRQNAGEFGDWLLIAPPLVIDEEGCDELLTGLSAALDDAAAELLDR
ncbi:MAG TPA: aminotransferase class III-fold pyridoxal phosphate-dependent enzyme [Candidatus Limnocylindrales bacterium]|nr:aminotransferase class III-fold pyridoxal phosphate-dependent enzyme [Candidatus Limnocylindrales bacterium]